jgi:hypothetical protein
MKKNSIMGAALFLLIGFTHASANGIAAGKVTPPSEHNILSTQLPAALLADIKNNYKDYWITECSEKDKKKQSDYFITLENADQIVQLRSDDSETWDVVNTIVKES